MLYKHQLIIMKMNKEEIEKKYNELLHDVKNDDFYDIDLTNRVNCYQCSSFHCRHITKTKDVDAGVTPFMFSCEKCGETARSTMYQDVAPLQSPTIEWYRPSLSETIGFSKERPGLVEHILKGGLNDRKIGSKSTTKRFRQGSRYTPPKKKRKKK